MPTYDYKCDNCGEFEHSQKITESPLKQCPKCQGHHIRRLISASGIVFKGSGFHVNDYGKKSAPKSSETKTAAKATETKTTETKVPESKPKETKTPTSKS